MPHHHPSYHAVLESNAMLITDAILITDRGGIGSNNKKSHDDHKPLKISWGKEINSDVEITFQILKQLNEF